MLNIYLNEIEFIYKYYFLFNRSYKCIVIYIIFYLIDLTIIYYFLFNRSYKCIVIYYCNLIDFTNVL